MAASIVSSAVVRDFVCLYTHDLKRKQKRWQDGRLKFHTFNKRVVVYDEGGNFIGDTHWLGDYNIEDGEELRLDRGGVIVQVAQYVGQQMQDISEIFARKPKQQDARSRTVQSPMASHTPSVSSVIRGHTPSTTAQTVASGFHLRHLPLLDLLSTPKAPIGRAAIPTRSPYEERQSHSRSDPADDGLHRSKRRRDETYEAGRSCYAKSLFGQTLNLSAQPTSSITRVPGLTQGTKEHAALSRREVSPTASSSFGPCTSSADSPGVSDNTPAETRDRQNRTHVGSGPSSGLVGTNETCQQMTQDYPALAPLLSRPSSNGTLREGVTMSRGKENHEPLAEGIASVSKLQKEMRERHSNITEKPVPRQKAGFSAISQSMPRRAEQIFNAPGPTAKPKPMLEQTLSEEPKGHNTKETSAGETMTELRIGSRKKRGLLLVAKKSAPTADAAGVTDTPETRAGPAPAKRRTIKKPESREGKAMQKPADDAAGVAGEGDSAERRAGPEPPEQRNIKNPATRGKKAARKSDAAGQVPQPVPGLETVSVAPDRKGTREGAAGSDGKPNTKRLNEAILPGFSRAGGRPWFQPWSKHAHDLLGAVRPARAVK